MPAKRRFGGVRDAARNLQRLGRVRLDAAAVVAAVHLHEEIERDAGSSRRVVEQARNLHVVGEEVKPFATPRQLDRLFELARLDGHGVGDVREAVRGEGARLGERRDGDAARVPGGLDARDLDALVRLDVRAQRGAELLDARADALGVAPDARGVEDEGRRLECVQVHVCCAARG